MSLLFLPESTEGVKEGATTAMDYENETELTNDSAETVAKQVRLNKYSTILKPLPKCALSILPGNKSEGQCF